MTGIFDSWSSDCLAQIFFQDEIPESKKFHNFYRIRDIDIIKSFGSNESAVGGVVSPRLVVVDHHVEKSDIYKRLVGFAKKFTRLKNIVREFLYKKNRWNSLELESWLKKFSPDAIFLVPSSYNFTYDVALAISDNLNIPIYVYYTDDYLGDDIAKVSNSYKKKALRTMKLSSGRFVIGEEMARVYYHRYGFDFNILINPVHIDKPIFPVEDISSKGFINIVYAGGLTLGRYRSLISFAKLLSCVEICLNKKITLKVCSGDAPTQEQTEVFIAHNIDFLGRLNSVEVDELYECADFLLHVESHLEKYVKMTRLSVSTKIPECLSSGIALIAYGPPEIASMKLIYEHDIGFYIDSRAGISDSTMKLAEIFTDQARYHSTIKRGFDYSSVNFSSRSIFNNLVGVIG